MKSDWLGSPLSEVCRIDRDQAVHSGLPYVGLEHIESHTGRFIGSLDPITVKSNTFRFSRDHVLYGRLRPYLNKVLRPAFDGHCSTEIFPLRPTSKLSPEFLQYWLMSDAVVDAINATCTGARMPRANMDAVMRFEMPVPPLAEQRRIVGILDEAFAAIATAKANAEKNLRNARGVFEAAAAELFTQAHPDWIERPLAEVTTKIGSGATPTGGEKAYKAQGISLIRSLNVYDDGFRYRDLAHIDETQASKLDHVSVKLNDVLLNITGASIARCCVVPEETLPARVNQHVMVVRPIPERLHAAFLHYLLTSGPYKRRLLGTGEAAGSTRQALTKTDVQAFRVRFPDNVGQQRELADQLNRIETLGSRLRSGMVAKLAALDDLKKSLLHHAFTGQLNADQPATVNLFGVPLPMSSMELHAGVLAIAYRMHESHAKSALFGHVKAEKVAHLVEALTGLEFGRVPIKDAAGPNDFRRMCDVEDLAQKEKYFTFQKQQGGYRFIKGERFDELARKAADEIGDKLSKLEELLKFVVSMDKTAIELFATVFAGWNNLLLAGKKPTLEEIVQESRENWHPDKLKIERKRFFETIEMMKKSGFVPRGTGKAVLAKGK